LTHDSLCNFSQAASQGNVEEAWALQYNQLLGKTFLVPLEQPKSILDEILKDTIRKKFPELMEDKLKTIHTDAPLITGPGTYCVVHCASSGHNIRCRPSLNAPPVGMVVSGNQIEIVEEVGDSLPQWRIHIYLLMLWFLQMSNSYGVWVKLDASSVSQYCHEVEGEAWCLARSRDSVTYLMHVDNLSGAIGAASALSFGAEAASKGFDFSTAQHKPNFPALQNGRSQSIFMWRCF
jgi:E3 ubiquitin-protein ligase MYCBP2